MARKITRRELLRSMGVVGAGALLAAACQPEVVKETVVVEGTPQIIEKEVTRVVKEVVEPEVVDILFMGFLGTGNMELATDAFNDRQTGIHVERQQLAWADYWDKLTTLFAAGTPPDVIENHTAYIRPHGKAGLLRDLNELIAGTPDFPTDFFKPMVDLFAFEGKQWGIAFDLGVRGIAYNKDMFDAAGIDRYPDIGWTYDDLRKWATKLTIDGNGKHPDEAGFDARDVKQWGMTAMVAQRVWANLMNPQIIAFGGRLFNEDDTECTITEPRTLEWCRWFQDAINDWTIHSRPEIEAELGNLFIPGQAAIYPQWLTYVNQLKEVEWQWEVAPFPKAEGGRHTFNVGAGCYSIPAKSPHPDEAWEFIRFMAGDEGNIIFIRFGVAVPRKTTMQMYPEVLNLPASWRPNVLERVDEYGIPVWQHKNRAEIQAVLTEEFDLVWTGQREVEEAAEAAKARVDVLLADA